MTTENETTSAAQSSVTEKPRWTEKLLYSRSFIARLALSDNGTRAYYAEIAKKLLGYKKVKSRVRWSGATFNAGRTAFAKITIAGKTLCLYLAANPDEITGKYKAKNVGDKKKYEKTPAMLKIRSDGALRGAIKAIEAAAAALDLTEKSDGGETAVIPADTFDNLVTRGLIRVLKRAGAEKNAIADTEEKPCGDESETANDAAQNAAEKFGIPGISDEGAASATSAYLRDLAKKYRAYEETLESMTAGDVTAELREKLMLRAVDERWMEKVENALGAIDYLMRNPGHYIEEIEEVLPVEMTKKITGRSIAHLGQHSDNVTVDDYGEIMPKKLLNVFREESIFTYENKFLNTLIARLYLFVTRRCEIAKKYATDEKHRESTYTAVFREGFDRAKVTVKVEYDKACHEDMRRTLPDTETRRRLEKLEAVVREYAASEFVTKMEGKYVNPPVLRTNAIVKNKYFRQCLNLWDFIERYDDAGFGLTVKETVLEPDGEYLATLGNIAAASYLVFRKNACGADDQAAASGTSPVIYPRIADEVHAIDPTEYDIIGTSAAKSERDTTEQSTAIEDNSPVARFTKEELARAVEVALYADELIPDPVENFEVDGAAVYDETEEAAEALADEAEEFTQTDTENGEEDGEEKFDFGGIKYVRTFHARIRLADEKAKERYVAILNAFLAFNKTRVKESNRYCAVYAGRKTLAKINVTGKTLKVYFALDPEKADKKYFLKNAGNSKTYDAVPALMRVKSDRALRYAEELIGVIATAEGLGPTKKPCAPFAPIDYAALTTEEFIARGWIKDLSGETAKTDAAIGEVYRYVPPISDEIGRNPTENNEAFDEAAATVMPPSPEILDTQADNAANEVVAAETAEQTFPDVVQVAADYSKPTDYGVDDARDFIEYMKPEPAKPDRKGLFKRLFSLFRKNRK